MEGGSLGVVGSDGHSILRLAGFRATRSEDWLLGVYELFLTSDETRYMYIYKMCNFSENHWTEGFS